MDFNNYISTIIKSNKIQLIYLFSAILGDHYRIRPLSNGLIIYNKLNGILDIDVYNQTMPLSDLFILIHLNDNTCKLINLNDLPQTANAI